MGGAAGHRGQYHTITVTGELFVTSPPGIGSSRASRTLKLDMTTALSHDRTRTTLTRSVCAGDQARGVLTILFELRSNESVVVSPTLRLFEGSSCGSDDLDAQDEGIQTAFAPRKSLKWRLDARNDELGSPDHARATFTLKHAAGSGTGIGRPAEPSAVVATRVAGQPSSVRVAWENPATDETRMEIRNTTLNQTKSLPTDSKSFTWPDLPLGQQCFQVRAVNDVGPSGWTPVNAKGECV
ncbi:fibronectin type III domain-containing protein [Streptomyces sp. JB150]|uniref:fibronectin type III domain-containing protein n=1 Tax=Streptomyces sp. JB150 TaxID=2714844 RepID=UPI00140B6840|nr:fibronectin type III domain-containing protein [Streptomyces sp. JB150]QIJ60725.1 fibronectin type III domain-containing protein [Streptomyces sp. JB150]